MTQRENFTKYLIKDVYEYSPYSPDSANYDKASAVYYRAVVAFRSLEDSGPPSGRQSALLDEERNQYYRDFEYAGLEVTKLWGRHQSALEIMQEGYDLPLAEKITQHRAVCSDFTLFTGYTLARVGIPSGIGRTYGIGGSHSFGLILIGDTPYVYDTTWGGAFYHIL